MRFNNIVITAAAALVVGCGGGGGESPPSGELGSYENPYPECIFATTQEYFDSKKWCVVIKAEGKTWKNLSYMAGEDDCKNPEALVKYLRCRIYGFNNIMSTDYLEKDVVEAPFSEEEIEDD
jgi:hypothetical protein